MKKQDKQFIMDLSTKGGFIDTDNIRFSLDGEGMAEHLEELGFEVERYYDNRRSGVVETREGIKVYTNGYVTLM